MRVCARVPACVCIHVYVCICVHEIVWVLFVSMRQVVRVVGRSVCFSWRVYGILSLNRCTICHLSIISIVRGYHIMMHVTLGHLGL